MKQIIEHLPHSRLGGGVSWRWILQGVCGVMDGGASHKRVTGITVSRITKTRVKKLDALGEQESSISSFEVYVRS